MNNFAKKILKHYSWSYTLVMLLGFFTYRMPVEIGVALFFILATLELPLKKYVNQQLTSQDYKAWRNNVIAIIILWLIHRIIFFLIHG